MSDWQAKRDEVREKFDDAEATTSSTMKWYIFSITQAYATGDGVISSRLKAFDTAPEAWTDAWERHCKPDTVAELRSSMAKAQAEVATWSEEKKWAAGQAEFNPPVRLTTSGASPGPAMPSGAGVVPKSGAGGEGVAHEPVLRDASGACTCGWPFDGVPRRWHQVDKHIKQAQCQHDIRTTISTYTACRKCGMEASQPAPAPDAWISVSERLPDTGLPVLIVWSGHVQRIAYKRVGLGFACADGYAWEPACDLDVDAIPGSEITEWQPLPAPPSAGKGDRRDR